MNAYVDGISDHKSLFEQVGVRKVDFVDGVTPDLDEKMFSGKGEFEVKYASSKKGPIKVSKFNTLKDAQKFLAQVKGEGMNGIISKGGKPVKEENIEEKFKKGKYTVRDGNTGKVIATYSSGEKASKEMHKLLDGGKYTDLEVKMESVKEALDSDDKPTVKKVVKMLKKASQAHAGQADDLEKSMKEDHHEKDANGEPIPHDDEEDIDEARKSYDDIEMRKKLKTPKHANRATARKEKEDRKRAQMKRIGLEQVEVDEKASDYEDQIKAFLSKGGKVKKHSPDQRKIDKVTKAFKKKYGTMKSKEAELDAKDREELEKMMGEENMQVDEKKGSDYDLYHKTFSGAMQHAYAQAKKRGYVVDKDDIDNKVATGPRKPSMGKTNRYILGTDKKQKLHVQVANLDNKRYELNMYIEEADPQSDIKKKVEKTAMKVAKDVVKSEAHDPKDYAKKVAAVNKMFKVKSPKELSPDQKKKYFNTLDRMHKAKGEKPEIGEDNVARLQKQIQRNNDRESKLKNKLAKEKQVTKTAKKMSSVGQAMRADIAPKSTGNTSASGTTTQSTTAKAAPKPKTQKPQSATMKNSFTPVGTFLEDTRVFMNGLWEKAANEADGMDMSGPPPVMGKKTMTKKSQDKVEINPKEEE
jgi:hypothetical protein